MLIERKHVSLLTTQIGTHCVPMISICLGLTGNSSSWVKIEDCIPEGVLSPCKNLPWLNKNLICAMRKRNQLYKTAKQSGDFSKYKFARNRVVSKLRMAKRAYFSNLNPKNPKKFWKAMKYLNKSQCSIPTLSHGDATVQVWGSCP